MILFSDDFSGTPGPFTTNASWTVTGTATAAIDGANTLAVSKAGSDSFTATTTSTFALSPFTFSATIASESSSPPTNPNRGTASMQIVDSVTTAQVATVDWAEKGNSLTFEILGGTVAASTTPAFDGTPHTFDLRVSGTPAMAQWFRDGVAQEAAVDVSAVTNMVTLNLSADWTPGGTPAIFHFDSVAVTSP